MHDHFAIDVQRGYRVRTHVPSGEAPAAGWPLIWLLDAPTTWAPMQQAVHEDGADNVVVIGIDWDHDGPMDQALRRRDFTWPPDPDGQQVDADAFLSLLCDQLQPHYLCALPADATCQTLAGHSLSGLFVLQTLLRRPKTFAAFAAASPSLWWQDECIQAQAKSHDWHDASNQRVLISVGSAEQTAGPERPDPVGDEAPIVLSSTHMLDNAASFTELLRERGVACDFHIIEGEGHRSVIPAAMAATLAFARGPNSGGS